MIEKLNFSMIKQEHKPFTTILNSVIQNLKDPFALGIYIFLSSLPHEWNVNRDHLMNHFGIGRDKLAKTLKYLNDHLLLEYIQERDADGKMGAGYILVKNGLEFEQEFVKKEYLTTPLKTRSGDEMKRLPTAPLKTRSPVNPPLIKETNTNKRNKDQNLSCSSGDERHDAFEEFWANYPRKQNKITAQKIWKREKLDKIAPQIIEDVKKRTEQYWKHKQKEHILLPSSYLNRQGWNDEIIPPAMPHPIASFASPFTTPSHASFNTLPQHRDFTGGYWAKIEQERKDAETNQRLQIDRRRSSGLHSPETYISFEGALG